MPEPLDPLVFLAPSQRRRVARLGRLVRLLRTSKHSRFALARALGVTPKTIQRDLLLLKRRKFRLRGACPPPCERGPKRWWIARG